MDQGGECFGVFAGLGLGQLSLVKQCCCVVLCCVSPCAM
jgi:hypothetical protein